MPRAEPSDGTPVRCTTPSMNRVGIAVLDDQAAGGRAADVIDLLIQRRQGELAVVR